MATQDLTEEESEAEEEAPPRCGPLTPEEITDRFEAS